MDSLKNKINLRFLIYKYILNILFNLQQLLLNTKMWSKSLHRSGTRACIAGHNFKLSKKVFFFCSVNHHRESSAATQARLSGTDLNTTLFVLQKRVFTQS